MQAADYTQEATSQLQAHATWSGGTPILVLIILVLVGLVVQGLITHRHH